MVVSKRWHEVRDHCQSTLARHSAIPRGTNVARMHANHVIQMGAQRTQSLSGPFLCFFGGGMTANERQCSNRRDNSRSCDSATTTARFRPSKVTTLELLTFENTLARAEGARRCQIPLLEVFASEACRMFS